MRNWRIQRLATLAEVEWQQDFRHSQDAPCFGAFIKAGNAGIQESSHFSLCIEQPKSMHVRLQVEWDVGAGAGRMQVPAKSSEVRIMGSQELVEQFGVCACASFEWWVR